MRLTADLWIDNLWHVWEIRVLHKAINFISNFNLAVFITCWLTDWVISMYTKACIPRPLKCGICSGGGFNRPEIACFLATKMVACDGCHTLWLSVFFFFFWSGKLPHGGNSNSGVSEPAALATDCLNNSQGVCKQKMIVLRCTYSYTQSQRPRRAMEKQKERERENVHEFWINLHRS